MNHYPSAKADGIERRMLSKKFHQRIALSESPHFYSLTATTCVLHNLA
jgi:hypothetical protein